jgi:O-antigen ligase
MIRAGFGGARLRPARVAGHPAGSNNAAGLAMLLGGIATAAVAGFLVLHGPLLVAVAFCVLPLVVWLFAQPGLVLLLLGASIPVTYSLTGNRAGFHLSPSDLLLVFAFAGLVFQATVTGSLPGLNALRAVKVPVVQYAVFMLLVLAAHLSVSDFFKTGQRFELFVLPLVVGAFAALSNRYLVVLKAYVLAASALAIAWPADHGLGQKNPVGQMIANGILVLIAIPSLRRFLPCLLLLVPGLLYTESRGAIGAAIVGVVVISLFTGLAARLVRRRIIVLAALAVVAFLLMPSALRTRVTTLSGGTTSTAAYTLVIRQQFSRDAEAIIKRHPWTGVGIGNYAQADSRSAQPAADPHEVVLLQAAEGGYGLAVSFVLLLAGTAVALFTRMRRSPLAAAAAAVLLATAIHGLVDVYWVRGTPILGWLLVGMACGELLGQEQEEQDQEVLDAT